jgi:threonine synthase
VIKGFRYSDEQIRETIKKVFEQTGYLCDPHGACGFMALQEFLKLNQVGVFLETAHPAKFTETVEHVVGKGNVPLPQKLAEFMRGKKKAVPMNSDFSPFKKYLMGLY